MEQGKALDVTLPPLLQQQIDALIKRGHYLSVNDYLSEVVRADLMKRAKDHLEQLVVEGLQSPSVPMSPGVWDEFFNQLKAKYGLPDDSQRRKTA